MIIAMIACVVLVGVLCVLAFNLATYAVPFMAGLAAAGSPITQARAWLAPALSASLPGWRRRL